MCRRIDWLRICYEYHAPSSTSTCFVDMGWMSVYWTQVKSLLKRIAIIKARVKKQACTVSSPHQSQSSRPMCAVLRDSAAVAAGMQLPSLQSNMKSLIVNFLYLQSFTPTAVRLGYALIVNLKSCNNRIRLYVRHAYQCRWLPTPELLIECYVT